MQLSVNMYIGKDEPQHIMPCAETAAGEICSNVTWKETWKKMKNWCEEETI